MIRRDKMWMAVAVVFTLVNLAGAAWAGAEAQALHAAGHVVGTLLGAFWIWRIVERAAPAERQTAALTDDRIEQLQQSVDAVALEVERVGEAQRFEAKLRAERAEEKR